MYFRRLGPRRSRCGTGAYYNAVPKGWNVGPAEEMTPLCQKGGIVVTLFILAGCVDYTEEERVDDVQEVSLVSVLKAPPDEEENKESADGDWDPGDPSLGQELIITLFQKAGMLDLLRK